MSAKRLRPDKLKWAQLCAKMTGAEIAVLCGVPKGTVGRWSLQYQLWPVFQCAICGERGPRENFISFKRCKACKGKKGKFPAITRVQRAALQAPYGLPELPLPATEGRLSYWQQMGRWMVGEHEAPGEG